MGRQAFLRALRLLPFWRWPEKGSDNIAGTESSALIESWDTEYNYLFLIYLVSTVGGVFLFCLIMSYFGDRGDYQGFLRQEQARETRRMNCCSCCDKEDRSDDTFKGI